MKHWLLTSVVLACSFIMQRAYAAFPAVVQASPSAVAMLNFKKGTEIIGFDVSRIEPQAAILVMDENRKSKVLLWNTEKKTAEFLWDVPSEYQPRNIIFHPENKGFFLLAKNQRDYVILKLAQTQSVNSRIIFKTTAQLLRLTVGPRPYVTGRASGAPEEYRLFFGTKDDKNRYSIDSVTERGKRKYQVIGPELKPKEANVLGSDIDAIGLQAASALPLAFHPAGHIMLWEDADNCFYKAEYNGTAWETTASLFGKRICGGTATITPNGLGVLNWRKDMPGVTLYLGSGEEKRVLASSYTFTSTPYSTPDGKGIIGEVKSGDGRAALLYTPVDVPLPDVVNAWMFAGTPEERGLFAKSGGLLRDLKYDQMYQLYESEGYDSTLPARPYLVTTDVFWEIFSAAYEGMFILGEQKSAMPAFRRFVAAGAAHFSKSPTRLGRIFQVLLDLLDNKSANEGSEAGKIFKASGASYSELLKKAGFFYGDLKPRGHYNATPETQTYFKTFRYLTMIDFTREEIAGLKNLPPDIKTLALAWINTYKPFIAPSRAPQFWQEAELPKYVARSQKPKATVFPLAWGMDNEIFDCTIHIRVPGRMLPSGLDIAAVMGSALAETLLESAGEFQKYPLLKASIADLRSRLAVETGGDNLYDKWISALAVQWNNAALVDKTGFAGDTWPVKRLQTGLASWATLRHTTVLVNERTAAESGEDGFEDIVMEQPRGYVEPDPAAFEAIAGLFDAASRVAKNITLEGKFPSDHGEGKQGLREGLLGRLEEVKGKALLFAGIARKEIENKPLTEEEYEAIQDLAGTAEHNFLVLKSLAKKDLPISIPDPMPKITDVSGSPSYGFLLSAVGRPMEWDVITPYFGRRQITRGAVYSYYEFQSSDLLNDNDWLKTLPQAAHPVWLQKFVRPEEIVCPPVSSF